MLMNKVRFAVVGTGNIIREFHLPALLQNPRAEVIGAANLHSESIEALARNFQITKTYTYFDHLAEDPDIDAVVIGLPNYLNAPVSIKMLCAQASMCFARNPWPERSPSQKPWLRQPGVPVRS